MRSSSGPWVCEPYAGSVIQSASKVLHEELMLDKKRVTSRDWVSYPILRFKDSPKVTKRDCPPARPRGVGLGRAAAALGERRDPERGSRRNGRAHVPGLKGAIIRVAPQAAAL